MTGEEAATVLLNAIAIVAFAWLYFVEFRKSKLAYFRSRLFAMRDEVFDLFLEADVPLNNEAHNLLRRVFNGYIREADLLHPVTVCMLAAGWSPDPKRPPFRVRFEKTLASLQDEDLRTKLQDYHQRLVSSVLTFMAIGSLSGLLCLLGLLGWAVFKWVPKRKDKRRDSEVLETVEPVEAQTSTAARTFKLLVLETVEPVEEQAERRGAGNPALVSA